MTLTQTVKYRPLVSMYRAVAYLASTPAYLDMSEAEFTSSCIQLCDDRVDPKRFVQIYYDLMKEAGVHAQRSPMKSFEDNGVHSWEYYVQGELINEDEYSAHSSYYKA